jgi:hypothetical protein
MHTISRRPEPEFVNLCAVPAVTVRIGRSAPIPRSLPRWQNDLGAPVSFPLIPGPEAAAPTGVVASVS